MATLQDFLTAAVVASGSGKSDLAPVIGCLDDFVSRFENGARRNALAAASQAISIIKLEGPVRDRLMLEIARKASHSPPTSV